MCKHDQYANSKKHWLVKKVDLSKKTSFRHRNVVGMEGCCIHQRWIWLHLSLSTCHEGPFLMYCTRENPAWFLTGKLDIYRIAFGVAQGLSYLLHHDCVPQIIYSDGPGSNPLAWTRGPF